MDVAPAHGPTQLAHSTLPQTHTQLNQTLHHHAHPDDADADGEGEGEYIDHLQQPGNTKKRKVPGVRSGSGGLAHGESDELALAHRELHHTQPETAAAPSPGPIGEAPRTTQQKTQRRRSKLARAALAGLQHKELLRTRKRQLAAVLGALSHGDTLALDQALSASFASLAADRLIATKEEVASLRKRFEAELARQASKAAKMSSRSLGSGSNGAGTSGKGGKNRRGKKKKRSALANASNPHHLRNYVPSRLPHSAPPSAGGDDLLSPLPLRFLSATSKKSRGGAGVQLTNPADEWI
ncbi:hypothetical protein DXG03_004689, partial [Asterophora parasitica]